MRLKVRQVGCTAMLLAAAALWPVAAGAITVDGQLDPSYTLVSTQTNMTVAKDSRGLATFSNGDELDAAYAAIDNGVLYLFFTGNLMDVIDGANPKTDSGLLNVFIDSQPGGQNTLISDSPSNLTSRYPGLTFDTAFTPDYWIQFAPGGALEVSFTRSAWYGTLPTAGGGVSYLLGTGTNAGAPGTLSGGTNPYGIQATIDNRNTAGVAAGCGAGSGAGVTTGVELAIPLAAIGSPTGCIGVSAFVDGYVPTNQVLPPVPAGTCSMPLPASLNFAGIPGNQFASVCLGATATHSATWGSLKAIYR